MVEDSCSLHHCRPAESVLTMVEARRHHHYILAGSIGTAKDVMQVVEISRVADSHQNVAGTNSQSAAAQLLVSVDSELIQILRLAMPGLGHLMFGIGENNKKHHTERDPGNGCFSFREQVHEGCGEQHGRDYYQSRRHFLPSDVEVPWYLPLSIQGFGITKHEHRQRLQGEAPNHAERVQTGQHINITLAEDNGQQLHCDDHVDDAIAGAVLG